MHNDAALMNADPARLTGANDWQVINSAPKDGTWFIAYRPKCDLGRWSRIEIVQWSGVRNAFIWADHFDVFDDDMQELDEHDRYVFDPFESTTFTHWMHLPEPPK